MRRFIAKAPQYILVWDNKSVVIDNQQGFETDDKQLIAALLAQPDFGNLVVEVPSRQQLAKDSKDKARKLLAELAAAPEEALSP